MARAFTLAELVISVGILAFPLLALFSVGLTALRVEAKSSLTAQATLVAETELRRQVYMAANDNPAGSKVSFFDAEYPFPSIAWQTGDRKAGETTFHYAVYAETLRDASGFPIGTANGNQTNKIKKVDIVVWWFGEQAGSKQGEGRNSVVSTRFVVQPR